MSTHAKVKTWTWVAALVVFGAWSGGRALAQPQDACGVAPDGLSCAGECGVPDETCFPKEIRADAAGHFLEVACCACDTPAGCHLLLDPATLEFSCTPDPACPVPPGGECRLIGHGNLDGTINYTCDCVQPEEPNECVYVEQCNADCPGTCVKRCDGVCPDPAEACTPSVIYESFPGAGDFHGDGCNCVLPGADECRPAVGPDGVYCAGVCPDGVNKCELVTALGADGVSQEYRCDPCTPNDELGACCYVTDMGSSGCSETTEADCLSSPANNFLGVGTTCAVHGDRCDDFNPEYGACCYIDPPTGQSVCAVISLSDCLNVFNGTYQGTNSVCDPDPCPPQSIGACCYVDAAGNPQCTQADPTVCELEYGGIYQGNGVDCDSNACPIEETCQCPGTCEDRTPSYPDQAYASFTDEVAVATENSQLHHDRVVVLIDIKNRNLAPLNLNWTPRTNSRYSHPSWTLANLGSVFGTALDVRGNIYVTAASCYAVDTLGSVAGATWGSVFKLDATTGAISVFANLPNTGPALGNICYHGAYDQFFVSNFEDGRIYRLDNAGACLGTFDHATTTISASCAPEGGDVPGFAPLGERVWGLQVHNNRLYYGVWQEDFSNASPAYTNTIWSIALTGGNFSGTPVLEISLPPIPGASYNAPLSMPPADIAFSQTGCMLVAERGMSFETWPSPHSSQVLEYHQTSSGVWVPSAFTYGVGTINNGTNSAGGVDYDRAGNVWATGDALQFYPLTVYGLQSLPCTGGTVANSVLVDLNGVYSTSDKTEIGDVEIGCSEKCLAPPRSMTAWFPLDENPGDPKAEEIVWDRDGYYNGTTSISGMVAAARRFNGTSDFVRVPNAAQHNFGTGDFSMDLWVRSTASTGLQVMLDKRDTTGGSRGFSLFLGNGTLGFQLGDGAGFTNYPRAGFFADGLWHHVAVTVDRDQATGLVMYVDGIGVTHDPTSHPGSVSSNADLWIGSRDPNFGQILFAGDLDEIELFNRVLTQAEVAALFHAGKQGKCKDRCNLPWDAQLCRNRSTVTVNLTICNDSPVAHNYVYAFAGNNNCSWPGPTVFSPPAGSVSVPANTCVQVPVTITRPAGMTTGNVACYNATITNLDTGHQFGCEGSVWARDLWCPRIIGTGIPIDLAVGLPVSIDFAIDNDGDPVGDFPYRLEVVPSDMDPDAPAVVSIDGLPPGQPVVGTLAVAPGTTGTLPVTLTLETYEPFRFYDLLLISEAGMPPGWDVPAGSVTLRGVLPCGDLNRDGVIDGLDAALFEQCLGGPDRAPDAACPITVDADCDDDFDVDLRDFATLQSLSGTVIYTP